MSSAYDSDMSSEDSDLPGEIEAYVLPLDDGACGENLEYDLQFMELEQLGLGKPETQFAPAEPPPWIQVQSLAEELMARTRDLRVVIWWTRAQVSQQGLPGLALGLSLLHALLVRYWDEVHPGLDPDDGDAFARINALGSLSALDGLLGDLRQSLVLDDRRLGGLKTRDIEIGLERIPARADETPPSLREIQGMLGDSDNEDLATQVRNAVTTCSDKLSAMQDFVNDKVGGASGLMLDDMQDMLKAIASALPDGDGGGGFDSDGDGDGDSDDPDSDSAGMDDGDDASADSDAERPSRRPRRGGGGGSIESRQDAVKAIQAICAYLERSEPTNPAQLLLRRAERLIEKNFLELMRELAPNALAEVALIMGVDPSSLGDES